MEICVLFFVCEIFYIIILKRKRKKLVDPLVFFFLKQVGHKRVRFPIMNKQPTKSYIMVILLEILI